jgi:hypothetical protein
MSQNDLDACRIASQIVEIEAQLALNHPDWLKHGIHLWPFYRAELYIQMFAVHAARSASSVKGKLPTLGSIFRFCKTVDADPVANKIWLVSDGISFSSLGDIQIEKFCEPIHGSLEKSGFRSVIIDRSSASPRESTTPSSWWSPLTQRAKLWGVIKATIFADKRHERLVRQITAAANALGIVLPPISAMIYNAKVNAIFTLAAMLEKRMQRVKPRLVCIVGFYDVGGFAYTLAAHKIGAISVDIQHGVTGSLHLGYADWNVPLSDGSALLPRAYLTWTESDALLLKKWFGKQSLSRLAFVCGHPFMQAWRAGCFVLPSVMRTQLNRVVDSLGKKSAILVTLQPGLSTDHALAPLLEVWRLQPDVVWWIRLHPLALTDKPHIEALLHEHCVAHWNIDDASALPLPSLLEHADFHATHSSSTVIEAELMGIPSIVWSDYGYQLFEDHITRGVANKVSSGAEFFDILAHHSICNEAAHLRSVPNQMDVALISLLETTK